MIHLGVLSLGWFPCCPWGVFLVVLGVVSLLSLGWFPCCPWGGFPVVPGVVSLLSLGWFPCCPWVAFLVVLGVVSLFLSRILVLGEHLIRFGPSEDLIHLGVFLQNILSFRGFDPSLGLPSEDLVLQKI